MQAVHGCSCAVGFCGAARAQRWWLPEEHQSVIPMYTFSLLHVSGIYGTHWCSRHKKIQCGKYPFPWNHPDHLLSYSWVKKFRHWWRVVKWWVNFLGKSSTRLTLVVVSVFLLEERGGSTSLVLPKKDIFFDIQETRGFLRILRRVWMCLYVFLIAVYKDRILFSLMLRFYLFCRSFIFSDNTESSSCSCIQTVGKY